MKNIIETLRPKLMVIEKSIFFRAFSPLVFLGLIGLNLYFQSRYEHYLELFTDGAVRDTILGLDFTDNSTTMAYADQFRTFQNLALYTLIALLLAGLILNFWASWAVSNFAAKKNFSKRQYFWLSMIIGPLIPLVVAAASTKTAPPEEPAGEK